MRDQIKDEKFFRNSLLSTKESIQKFEEILSQVIEQQGVNSQGVQNGKGILEVYYTKKVNLMYSIGAPIADIQESFEKLLYYYAYKWDLAYGYIGLVRVLSLCVLLNISNINDDFIMLEKKIKEAELKDYLVDLLINFVDSDWKLTSTGFHFKGCYEQVKDIIENEDKHISEAKLKIYLDKQWYKIHRQCAWYSTHKSKQDTYYGYWAYEAAAISKILKLDDKELKEQEYYPYDFVHFDEITLYKGNRL